MTAHGGDPAGQAAGRHRGSGQRGGRERGIRERGGRERGIRESRGREGPGRRAGGQLRVLHRLITGEAGLAPALVLAGVAVVIAFIAAAGPRALISADNRAVIQAVTQAPTIDMGALVTAQLQAGPGNGAPGAATIEQISAGFAAELPTPRLFPAAQRWAAVTLPAETVLHPAPSASSDLPPQAEVSYRDTLTRHCIVVAGTLPTGPGPAGAGGVAGQAAIPVAATQAVAARFSLRVGSVVDIGTGQGTRQVQLKVTGILRPTGLSSSFWQGDPLIAAPVLESPPHSTFTYWAAGFIAGPADLTALSGAYAGTSEQYSWFFPVSTKLTGADINGLEAGLARLAVSPLPRTAEVSSGAGALQDTAVSNGIADGLGTFTAQWMSTSGADSLLVLGLFAAGLALLLICCGLAAEAYRTELVLLRVRGGSLAQVAGRMLVRSCFVALPGLACGVLLAVAVLPGDSSRTGWIFFGLTALTAVTATPLLCVLRHRRLRFADTGRRSDLVTLRPSWRRLVAELFVFAVAVAAVADVRLRGTGSVATVPYLSASAVLVAVAVGLVVNRVYRGPLRGLATMASRRRGPVGAVGLARAARAPAGSVLPALTLILTLTLTAFSLAVGASVAAGQVAASWAQAGADATVTAVGTYSVTSADLRAMEHVPGVVHATAVYIGQSQSPLAAAFASDHPVSPQIGLAVVDPASYGALSAATPWSGFPQRALSPPRPGSAAVVPILVSQGTAARAAAGSHPRLEFDGLALPVRVVGTITETAAMPSGGDYVVLPSWAAPRWPAIPAASTVLITGSAINVARLTATAARLLPGSQVVVRRQILDQLAASPALHLSEWLYLVGILCAAALSALAVLFALSGSARGRAATMTRLAALGMSRRQVLLLGLTDAIPLVWVAGIGAVAASWLLVEVIGPVLGLNVFTGSLVTVPLRPTWQALVIPLAGVAALAVAFLAADGAAFGRRQIGAAVRQEEEAG